MDCLEAMKQMPDNAFDLAVVDPPYGDGSQVVLVERERETVTERGADSDNDLTATNTRLARVNRGGWHGKNKYHLGTASGLRTAEGANPAELVDNGRRSTQKNHNVGRRAGSRVF